LLAVSLYISLRIWISHCGGGIAAKKGINSLTSVVIVCIEGG